MMLDYGGHWQYPSRRSESNKVLKFYCISDCCPIFRIPEEQFILVNPDIIKM